MKQKLLLLGASMVLLGTVAFGGALSFPEFTDNESTANVNVFDPDGPSIDLADAVAEIAADNVYHLIANIDATDSDTNYDYTLTDLELDDAEPPVIETATCGTWDFSLDDTLDEDAQGGLTTSIADATVEVGSVYLKISPVGTTATCALSSALVTATFIVEGDTPGGSP
jgi:septal ring-binding cell division protein DamX